MAAEIVGGLIGAFATIAAIILTIRHERKNSLDEIKSEVMAFARCIHTELSCLRDRYQSVVGDEVEKCRKDGFLNFTFPVYEDYFTVYNGNASLLGKIVDSDLRSQIVKTYICAKGHIDTFRLHNDLIEKAKEFGKESPRGPSTLDKIMHGRRQETLEQGLIESTGHIISSHVDLKAMFAKTIQMLDTYIKKN